MATDFKLPELGEQIAGGDVLRVMVKPGETIAKDQAVLELETDKATIEVPSSVAGVVKSVNVKAGEKVKVGQVILTVEDGAAASAPAAKAAEPSAAKTAEPPAGKAAEAPAAAAAAPKPAPAPTPADERVPDTQPDVPARKQSAAPDKSGVKDPSIGPQAQSAPTGDRGTKVVDITRGARAASEPAAPDVPPAPAAPSVRRMARELGVDINGVPGTGPSGRISIDDVKARARGLVSASTAAGAPRGGAALPDFSRWGAIDRQPMRAVRRKTAEHLASAWATIPHVTQYDLADITGLEELRKKYAKQAEAAGGHLTMTAIALKIVASALKVFPQFNASIDMAAEEIVFKKYIHIGVAVDTDRGLLVPVVRDVDTKNILQISADLTELSEKARSRKLALDEMQGGCFSISNLGGIGGTAFSPIVNEPEVAILGISRARTEPVYRDGAFVPRLMLPLSLSYDHRAIDGADGARFLRWVADAFEQPFLLALQG